MLNAMVLPLLDGQESSVEVCCWIKSEGDYVDVGEPVLEMKIELRWGEDDSNRPSFYAELVAAEKGYLVHQCVGEHHRAEKGQPLALFAPDPSVAFPSVRSRWRRMPRFHALVHVIAQVHNECFGGNTHKRIYNSCGTDHGSHDGYRRVSQGMNG